MTGTDVVVVGGGIVGSAVAYHCARDGQDTLLLETARDLAPGLDPARLEEVRVGLRPVTPDGLPVLGRVPGVEGAVLATGHGATGLQLGPFTGRLVAALIAGRDPPVAVSPFRVTRFGDG